MRSETILWHSAPTVRSAWQASVRAAALLAAAWVSACADESVVDPPLRAVASDVAPNAMALAQASDRDILVALYEATDGRNWGDNTNWLTDKPLGEWFGVRTDADGRVVDLDLGELGPVQGRFHGNGLAGEIPPELGSLSRLSRLNLAYNDLTGSIPPELGGLANLRTLWLIDNSLTGSIPPELGGLANLWQAAFNHNRLTGALPSTFLQLSKLSYFYFSENAGLCAPGIAGFVEWLSGMEMFEGEGYGGPFCNEADVAIVKSLHETAGGANWTNSEGWLLDTPVLEGWHGVIADSLGRVKELDLANNRLVGRLPASLGNLASMTRLSLGDNPDLAGRLPESLPRTPLEELRYANTGLCAPAETSFQHWLASIPQHEGTGVQCPPLSDREILIALYEATGGPDWVKSSNWLTDAPLRRWHGVSTSADGRVVSLDLRWNRLQGPIPPELGALAELDTLILFDNRLTGSIPPALGNLAKATLVVLASNKLTGPIPPELGGLAAVEELHLNQNQLTSAPRELGSLAKLAVLGLNQNQLTSAPRELGSLAKLAVLGLNFNQLTSVPPELGGLGQLEYLGLWSNELTSVPPELGQLGNLRVLDLDENRLTSLPPELARLDRLEWLWLGSNELTSLPAELSALEQLWLLVLEGNRLSSFPLRSGGYAGLGILDLSSKEFTSFPWELGGLDELRVLALDGNRLTDIPPGLGRMAGAKRLASSRVARAPHSSPRRSGSEDPWRVESDESRLGAFSRQPDKLGDLRAGLELGAHRSSSGVRARTGGFPSLAVLDLSSNELSGPLPAGLLEFTGITSLGLAGNAGLAGPLPLGLTALEGLEDLHTTGTGLCAPADPEFVDWLDGVTRQRVALCERDAGVAAYLTQAVQSREFPVPLVAGEPALLRVFVTAQGAADARIPPVRATFYRDGAVTHVADIPGTSDPIPAAIDESSLSNSANAEIPGWVIQPGLGVVIEPDPAGTLDPALGVARRIPATGRMSMDVRAMPVFEVTLVPFIWQESPDSSIIATVDAMAADPEGHELFERTHLLLPVSEIDATAHGPVLTSTNNGFELLEEVEMIRVAEGGRGHYLAVMAGPTGPGGLRGVANDIGSWSSFSVLDSETIAHEFGHNRNLYHAPCGGAGGPDRYYPYGKGNIGAWGYDFGTGELVPPGQPDFMSYCEPTWTSDYQFTNAVRYRIETETGSILIATAAASAVSGRVLMLWGGLDGAGAPRLRPSFFIDAPPALPEADGPWSLTGTDSTGTVLFSLSFAMAEFTDTDDDRAGFSFAVPVTWTDELAAITLQGPEGSASLDGDTDLPMTILRDPATGRIRGILDGPPAQAATLGSAGAAAARAAQDLEVLFSRGIPNRGSER